MGFFLCSAKMHKGIDQELNKQTRTTTRSIIIELALHGTFVFVGCCCSYCCLLFS